MSLVRTAYHERERAYDDVRLQYTNTAHNLNHIIFPLIFQTAITAQTLSLEWRGEIPSRWRRGWILLWHAWLRRRPNLRLRHLHWTPHCSNESLISCSPWYCVRRFSKKEEIFTQFTSQILNYTQTDDQTHHVLFTNLMRYRETTCTSTFGNLNISGRSADRSVVINEAWSVFSAYVCFFKFSATLNVTYVTLWKYLLRLPHLLWWVLVFCIPEKFCCTLRSSLTCRCPWAPAGMGKGALVHAWKWSKCFVHWY